MVFFLFFSDLKRELTEDPDFCLIQTVGLQTGSDSDQLLELWEKTAPKRIAYCRAVQLDEYSDLCYYSFLPIIGPKLVRML